MSTLVWHCRSVWCADAAFPLLATDADGPQWQYSGEYGPMHWGKLDDAHLLADGKFLTADIRNCRVLIVDPKDDRIASQWGQPRASPHDPPRQLAFPNGATPLGNGDILVTEISDSWVSRITRDGKATWEYFFADGEKMLDRPSIARELPDTGDVLIVDDQNDCVIEVDRKMKDVIWQCGVLGVKGHAPGHLNYPDVVELDLCRDCKRAEYSLSVCEPADRGEPPG